MQTYIHTSLWLFIVLFYMAPARIPAQVFTNLCNFSAGTGSRGGDWPTNTDGAYPLCSLTLIGNTLYGTTVSGGDTAGGVLFKVNTDGSNFTPIHYFDASENPNFGLIYSGGRLYGTVPGSGSVPGTLYSLNLDGSDYTRINDNLMSTLRTPTGTTISGNTVYVTETYGGTSGYYGGITKINTDGTGFTLLHSFDYGRECVIRNGAIERQRNEWFCVQRNPAWLYNAPSLNIIHKGKTAIVSWPSALTNWTLQTNDSLSQLTWHNYVGTTFNNSVTNSLTKGNQFFRLANP